MEISINCGGVSCCADMFVYIWDGVLVDVLSKYLPCWQTSILGVHHEVKAKKRSYDGEK